MCRKNNNFSHLKILKKRSLTLSKSSNCVVEVIECTGHIFENMTVIAQRKRGAKLEMNRAPRSERFFDLAQYCLQAYCGKFKTYSCKP